MNRSLDILDNIRIASPCTADWDAMQGDDRVRFCGQCQKHVYNLSEMRRAAAIELVTRTEAVPCVVFYRRRDGTVMTSDCPMGLRWIRQKSRRLVAAIAGLLGVGLNAVAGCGGGARCWGEPSLQQPGRTAPTTRPSELSLPGSPKPWHDSTRPDDRDPLPLESIDSPPRGTNRH